MALEWIVKLDQETAIVLLEAGEPARLEDVDVFLRQFLSDNETNPLPFLKKPFRRLMVDSVLAQEAENYKRDFADIGVDSPLHRVCGGQANGIAELLGCEGYVAMNHGQPSTQAIVKLMAEEGMKRALVVPMDPHVANHSTRAAVEHFRRDWLAAGFGEETILVVNHWAQDERIMAACADYYAETLDLVSDDTQVIFVAKDPGVHALRIDSDYEQGVLEHGRALAKVLKMEAGPAIGWLSTRCTAGSLQPTVDSLIETAAKNGASSIALVPFAWVADCFETLCSIDMLCGRLVRKQKRRLFRVPTINDRPEFLQTMARYIGKQAQGAAK